MYKIYILQSLKSNKFYIGHTSDIEKRLFEHNNKRVRSTKYGAPWRIVYSENFGTKSEAFRREMEIKSYKGGYKFKNLLNI